MTRLLGHGLIRKKGLLSLVQSWHEHVQAIITAAFVVLGSDITSELREVSYVWGLVPF